MLKHIIYALTNLTIIRTIQTESYCYPNFTDEKSETQSLPQPITSEVRTKMKAF